MGNNTSYFKQNKSNKIKIYFICSFTNFKFLLIFILLNIFFISKELSEINLIIKGDGVTALNFINNYYNVAPSEVIINKEIISSGVKTYIFPNGLNNVTIKFDTLIKSSNSMFKALKNITEINLSNFDFSNVEDMCNMFEECSDLEKIVFGNINTSSLKYMSMVFYNCINLASL